MLRRLSDELITGGGGKGPRETSVPARPSSGWGRGCSYSTAGPGRWRLLSPAGPSSFPAPRFPSGRLDPGSRGCEHNGFSLSIALGLSRLPMWPVALLSAPARSLSPVSQALLCVQAADTSQPPAADGACPGSGRALGCRGELEEGVSGLAGWSRNPRGSGMGQWWRVSMVGVTHPGRASVQAAEGLETAAALVPVVLLHSNAGPGVLLGTTRTHSRALTLSVSSSPPCPWGKLRHRLTVEEWGQTCARL